MIFVCITSFLVTAENVQFAVAAEYGEEGEVIFQTMTESLLDQFDTIEMRTALCVIFFFPFLLMIEATFFPEIRNSWRRILFLIQAIALSYGTLVVLLFMVFKLFTDIQELPAFYFVMLYLSLGVLWNLLLILPNTKKLSWIQKSFEIMSFRKSTPHV